MSNMKCIGCGANESQFVVDSSGKRYCPFCGNEVDLKVESPEVLKAIKLSCQLRDRFMYMKSLAICKKLLESDSTSPIYNWYALLANYKVTYIDNGNGVQEATFLDTNVQTPINQSKYYKYLSPIRKKIADKLQNSRMAYKEQALKVVDYDVFISYKKHDINDPTRETKEAKWANQLYHYLDKKGYKVFYDSECLLRSNVEWEPHIYGALKKAKMLILCGSSNENIEAQWVKNEWKRFLAYKRLDKSKTLCILGLNIDPNKLTDPELKLTQMVGADDGNWLQIIEGRVKDACHKKEEKKTTANKKKINEKLIDVRDIYDKEKDDSLDRININLQSQAKRQKAITTFNAVYKASSDTNTISSKEMALDYVIKNNLDSLDDLFNMEIYKNLTDKTIYNKILAYNDNDDLMNKTISFVYKAILLNYNQSYINKLFLDVIRYKHEERASFIKNLYPLVSQSPNSNIMFDKLLPIIDQSPEDDIDALLKYSQLELKRGAYDLAIKYSTNVIESYDRKNFRALEIIFLANNKSRSYEECFSFKNITSSVNPLNLASLSDLLQAIGVNSFTCKKCNHRLARLMDGITYVCPSCSNQEIKYERYYDSISILDNILGAILKGILEPKGNNQSRGNQGIEVINSCYKTMLERILLFYPPEERKYRLYYIAKGLHQKGLFKLAIYYYNLSEDVAPRRYELNYNLLLCDLECITTNDIFSSNKPMTDSIYYKRVRETLIPNSDEELKLNSTVEKQKQFLNKPTYSYQLDDNTKALVLKAKKRKVRKNRILTFILLIGVIVGRLRLNIYDLDYYRPYQKTMELVITVGLVASILILLLGLIKKVILKRKFLGHLLRFIIFLFICFLVFTILLQHQIIYI